MTQGPVPDDERPVSGAGHPADEDTDLLPDEERPVSDPGGAAEPTAVPDDERPVPPADIPEEAP